MIKQQVARVATIFLLAAILAACGQVKPSLTTPEQTVGQRSQQRVDAMVSGDYKQAYSYYTPGYRSSVGEADFIVRFKVAQVKWTGGRFVDAVCEDAVCTARVDIDYFIDEPLRGVSEHRGSRRIEEKWINVADQWYYVDES